MKRLIPMILMLVLNIQSNAQITGVFDGIPYDSVTFTFNKNDSLTRSLAYIDTTGSGVWEIGTTAKSFFAAGGNLHSIMTDTAAVYDTSIDNSFKVILKAFNFNSILSFKHKYQTRSGHDGGIVEYSIDSGATWENVLGDCHTMGTFKQGIFTENFYKKTDTLLTGEPAFTGTNSGWVYSRVQLFYSLPIKSTGGGPQCVTTGDIHFRFRFLSDNQVDTFDGWIIDEIKVEHDMYGGGISNIANNILVHVYPNPTNNILNIEMPEVYFNKASLINTIGQTVNMVNINSRRQNINISQLPVGIYQLVLQGEYGTKTMLINKE